MSLLPVIIVFFFFFSLFDLLQDTLTLSDTTRMYKFFSFFITVIKLAHLKVWAAQLDLLKWLTITTTEWNRTELAHVSHCLLLL